MVKFVGKKAVVDVKNDFVFLGGGRERRLMSSSGLARRIVKDFTMN